MAYKIVIDPGHGGQDPGAVFEGRQEKDDNLDLGLAVGQLLEDQGIDVVYTRIDDVYNTPFEKATMGNNANADLFVSFHRNAAAEPGRGSGAEVLVYNDAGLPASVARSVLEGMETAGFENRGVTERKDLVVLRRTRMPAVLLEVGFIDNPEDNAKFDDNFELLAQEIADGILRAIPANAAGADPAPDWRSQVDLRPESEINSGMGMDMASGAGMGMDMDMASGAGSGMTSDMSAGMAGGMSADMSQMLDSGMDSGMGSGMNEYPASPLAPRQNPYPGAGTGRPPASNMGSRPPYPGAGSRPPYPVQNTSGSGQTGTGTLYRVQTGAFRDRRYADAMRNELLASGFPAFILYRDGLFKVQVGAFAVLENAIRMERVLRNYGYNTYITT